MRFLSVANMTMSFTVGCRTWRYLRYVGSFCYFINAGFIRHAPAAFSRKTVRSGINCVIGKKDFTSFSMGLRYVCRDSHVILLSFRCESIKPDDGNLSGSVTRLCVVHVRNWNWLCINFTNWDSAIALLFFFPRSKANSKLIDDCQNAQLLHPVVLNAFSFFPSQNLRFK